MGNQPFVIPILVIRKKTVLMKMIMIVLHVKSDCVNNIGESILEEIFDRIFQRISTLY